MSDEKVVVTNDGKKKIGFFSAILIVLGGSIGAGIFLRAKSVLENSGGNIVWALIVWLIAGFTVVCLALALIEVASGRNDNLGMIGWNKAFNTLPIYKGSKFFMTYLYLPFTYFFMPYYAIVQFQDAMGGFKDGGEALIVGGVANKGAPWVYFAIGLAITLWMIFSAGISSRAGNIQNWIITSVKFIPLLAVVIVGFAFAGKDGVVYNKVNSATWFNKESTSFFGLSPFFGVFNALGGIFFAFDGFYVTAGVQSEMKHPEKTPAALAIGLFSMTIIYMIIATAMSLGAKDGGFYTYGDKLRDANYAWAFGVINICISVGILGILNGFTMWATRWVEDLIKEGEITIPAKAYKYMMKSKMPMVGALFVLILSLPYMIIFTVIGAYAYIPGGYASIYGYKIDELLTFSDLMANWMAVMAFAFIGFAILGCIANRKKHFIAVKENKNTLWAGYIGVVIVLVTMLMIMIAPYISFFLVLGKAAKTKDWAGSKNDLISQGATSLLLPVFLAITFGANPIERKVCERKEKVLLEKINSGKYSGVELQDLQIDYELNARALETYRTARVN